MCASDWARVCSDTLGLYCCARAAWDDGATLCLLRRARVLALPLERSVRMLVRPRVFLYTMRAVCVSVRARACARKHGFARGICCEFVAKASVVAWAGGVGAGACVGLAVAAVAAMVGLGLRPCLWFWA